MICSKIGMEKAHSSFVRPTANDSAAYIEGLTEYKWRFN
jgi:hypothetical protein